METKTNEKAELAKLIEEKAYAYARSVVVNPDLHKDAVDCIASDFIQGAFYVLSQNFIKK